MIAFPDSAQLRVFYSLFIKTIQMDQTRSYGMLLSNEKLPKTFEDKFRIYSFERIWEQDRISSELGEGIKTMNVLLLLLQHPF